MSGVTINVYDTNGTSATSLTTDSSGVYTATLTTGTYSMSITKRGYDYFNKRVFVHSGGKDTQMIEYKTFMDSWKKTDYLTVWIYPLNMP